MSNRDSYFTNEQWSVIIGSLLGDGHITRPPYGHSALSKPQCAANFEYLKWHQTLFAGKCGAISTGVNRANGKSYVRHQLRLFSHPVFTELRRTWYPDGSKSVPSDVELDPLSIAIWFFDDGSNDVDSRQAKFATYCFDIGDLNLLKKQLDRFSIKCRVAKNNVLCVKTESYKTLVDLIKPYMLWDCFKHKIAYRDSQLRFTTDNEARQMIDMQSKGMTVTAIAKKFNCSRSVVSAMIRGLRKKHLGQPARTLPLNNTSGHKGVCYDKSRGKWLVSRRVNGKLKNMGRFDTLEEAICVITTELSSIRG